MSQTINLAGQATSFDGLLVKPDLRPVLFSYLMPAVCSIILLMAIFVPYDGIRFAFTFGIIPGFLFSLYLAIKDHVRLTTARYAIAPDYLEASIRADLFNQTTRRIPFAYIRDVTLQQGFFQSFFNVSNITVATTNGDKIILENLNDARKTEAAIWELVLSHSPTAAQDNLMKQKGG